MSFTRFYSLFFILLFDIAWEKYEYEYYMDFNIKIFEMNARKYSLA